MESQVHTRVKPLRSLGMEGPIAGWYAKHTRRNLADFTDLAKRLAAELAPDARVLEIAPGPGYLAIELAKLGARAIVGLDISRSFVAIARANAAAAGVAVEFRQGDVAAMPFADASFDAFVCRAAFKNFGDPAGALAEMHRVLAPGGRGLIIDMRPDVSDEAIAAEVDSMEMTGLEAFTTRLIFKFDLKRRAYSKDVWRRMLAASPFCAGVIREVGIGYEVNLAK